MLRRGGTLWMVCCFAWAITMPGCLSGPPWFVGTPVPPGPVSAKTNRPPSRIEADLRLCLLQQDQACALDLLTELELRRPLNADEGRWLGNLLWGRANRYAAAKQYRAAVRVYERAQRLVELPPVGPWYLQAGDEALSVGDLDEAQQLYSRAFALQPTQPDLQSRAWLLSVRHAKRSARPAPSLEQIGLVLLANPAHGFAGAAHAYVSLGGADPLVLKAALVIAAAAGDEALEGAVKAVAGAADLGRPVRFANDVVTCPGDALARADVQANPGTLEAAACAVQSGQAAWAERLVRQAVANAADPAAARFKAALLWEAHDETARACSTWAELAIHGGTRAFPLRDARLAACTARFPQLRRGPATAADLQSRRLPL